MKPKWIAERLHMGSWTYVSSHSPRPMLNPLRMNRMKTSFSLAALASCLLLLVGCASPVKPQAMVPATFDVQNRHNSAVQLMVEGGQEDKIPDAAFLQALTDAIQRSGVFSAVVPSGGDYKLVVVILALEGPQAGFSFTVKLATNWKLTRLATQEVVWQDAIAKTYNATMGRALFGATRARIATEGAAQENIKEGIDRLSRVKL
jgi:hypothetical protein